MFFALIFTVTAESRNHYSISANKTQAKRIEKGAIDNRFSITP
jgi:hypothetical protein